MSDNIASATRRRGILHGSSLASSETLPNLKRTKNSLSRINVKLQCLQQLQSGVEVATATPSGAEVATATTGYSNWGGYSNQWLQQLRWLQQPVATATSGYSNQWQPAEVATATSGYSSGYSNQWLQQLQSGAEVASATPIWGTPDVTGSESDWLRSITTHWCLFVR